MSIVKPIVKEQQKTNKQVLSSVLSEACSDHSLKTFIADNPKRAIVRESLSHAAKFACEYCFSHGEPVKNFVSNTVQNEIVQLENLKSQTTNTETREVLDQTIKQLRKKKEILKLYGQIIPEMEKSEPELPF